MLHLRANPPIATPRYLLLPKVLAASTRSHTAYQRQHWKPPLLSTINPKSSPLHLGKHTQMAATPSQLNTCQFAAFTTCSSNWTTQPSDQAHCLWGMDPIPAGKSIFSVETENEKCLYHSLSTSPAALVSNRNTLMPLFYSKISMSSPPRSQSPHTHTQRIKRSRLDSKVRFLELKAY